MKKLSIFILALGILFGASACHVHHHGHPHGHPGKGKKVHGKKTGKHHAPGQYKKKGKGKHKKYDVYFPPLG